MYKALDPILHNELRLKIMSVLIGEGRTKFNELLKISGATRGNLSAQITKLKEAGYIDVKKSFRNNYPLTTCNISNKGINAFEAYVQALSAYIRPVNN